jgi:hypothetical protein
LFDVEQLRDELVVGLVVDAEDLEALERLRLDVDRGNGRPYGVERVTR